VKFDGRVRIRVNVSSHTQVTLSQRKSRWMTRWHYFNFAGILSWCVSEFFVYMYTRICTYTCIWLFIHIHTYMWYVSIYTYMNMYTYSYTYTCIHTPILFFSSHATVSLRLRSVFALCFSSQYCSRVPFPPHHLFSLFLSFSPWCIILKQQLQTSKPPGTQASLRNNDWYGASLAINKLNSTASRLISHEFYVSDAFSKPRRIVPSHQLAFPTCSASVSSSKKM